MISVCHHTRLIQLLLLVLFASLLQMSTAEERCGRECDFDDNTNQYKCGSVYCPDCYECETQTTCTITGDSCSDEEGSCVSYSSRISVRQPAPSNCASSRLLMRSEGLENKATYRNAKFHWNGKVGFPSHRIRPVRKQQMSWEKKPASALIVDKPSAVESKSGR